MKKSFFKKLSFVLALAMIVSTIAPAASAFAAATPKISTTATQYLLLGQSNEYDFNVANKVAGATYKWTSNNTKVATVSTKGVAVAKAVGTATIKLTATVKGKKYASSAKVVVKDNFKTLKIAGAPADGKLAVNAENTFSTTGTTYGGASSSKTAVIGWAVTDADGKATTGATITDAGVFKATVAGTYKVVATAYQSSAKKTAGVSTATDSTTVTVANTMTANQTDLNTFTATFATPITDKSKLSVSYLIGDTTVAVVPKAVALSTDGKTVTVDLYANMSAGSTYTVAYPDVQSATFVAASSKVTDVKSIAITSSTTPLGATTALSLAAYDANGVDILNGASVAAGTAASDNSDVYSRITLKADSNATATVNGKTVFMYTVGATATITATYHTYNYDNTTGTETGILTASKLITCVAAENVAAKNITAYTFSNGSPFSGDFTTVNHSIAVGDTGYYLYTKLVIDVPNSSTDQNDSNTSHGTAGTNGTYPGTFSFASSDSSVLIMNGSQMIPVAAGTTTVVVSYQANGASSASVVAAIPVTVSAKRKVGSVTLSTNTANLSNAFADGVDVTVNAKDQYGSAMDTAISNYQVTYTLTGYPSGTYTAPVVSTLVTASGTTSQKYHFATVASTTTAGTYVYQIAVYDTTAQTTNYAYVSITVAAPSGTGYTSVSVSSPSVDEYLTSSATDASVTISAFTYGANGVKSAQLNASTATVTAPSGTALTNSMTGYAATVLTTSGNNLVVDLTAPVGGVVKKLPTGTYRVDFVYNTVTYTTYFTVKDTTPAVTLAINATNTNVVTGTAMAADTAGTGAKVTAAKAVLSLTYGGNSVTGNITAVNAVGSGTQWFIYDVTYSETVGGNTVLHTVTVNSPLYLAS